MGGWRQERKVTGILEFGLRIGGEIDSTLFEERDFVAGWSSQVARQAHNPAIAGPQSRAGPF